MDAMDAMKRWASACAKVFKRSRVLTTAVYFWRICVKPKWNRMTGRTDKALVAQTGDRDAFDIRVAFVCDEMSWKTFSPLCRGSLYVQPEGWKDAFEQFRPDLFFCESAWLGLETYGCGWRSRVFRNHRVMFDNRKDLLQILAYCKANGIKTVFWNKEDPTYFDDEQNDFADTALRFDYIFTTAQECIDKYRAKGHERVGLMQFGFTPKIFHPLGRSQGGREAVYAGSWFADHPQRCRDTERMFDLLEQKKISVTIYDRQLCRGGTSSFPKRYVQWVKEAVPYEKMGELYRQYALGVNINTVTESPTMFARRVLEMMACGLPVVSNTSRGLYERFGEKIGWMSDEGLTIPQESCVRQLLREVFLNDTVKMRFRAMLQTAGVPAEATEPTVDVYCIGKEAEAVFEQIEWKKKCKIRIDSLEQIKEHWGSGAYAILLNRDSEVPDIAFWLTQFEFLPEGCGVGKGKRPYQIEAATSWSNVLWRSEECKNGTLERLGVYGA